MKAIYFLLFIISIVTAICCENDQLYSSKNDQLTDDQLKKVQAPEGYSTGKILINTCGGSVIQFLNTDSIIGADWTNYFTTDRDNYVKYSNCVNALNIAHMQYHNGDTLYFQFKILDFDKGDQYGGIYKLCDIGGLPKTSVELLNVIKK